MTVIGVTLRPFTGADFPQKLALNRAYFQALDAAGAAVIPIPVEQDVEKLRFLYERLDALVLPGGADVEPRRYGSAPREDCHLTLMPELDEVELNLARWSIEDDRPVLAICRGIQLLNVACGGTLWQDLVVEGATTQNHDLKQRDLLAHDLAIEPRSRLADIVGESKVRVNSLHHQAIRDVAEGLKVVGRTPDGLTEAVEMSGRRFVVGVQCHPEEIRAKTTWADSLFEALVAAASSAQDARSKSTSRA